MFFTHYFVLFITLSSQMKSGLYVRPRTHAQCDIMSNFGLSITVYRGYVAELAEEGNTVVNLGESKEKRETRLFR